MIDLETHVLRSYSTYGVLYLAQYIQRTVSEIVTSFLYTVVHYILLT